jgi:hypothetical protein
VQPVALTDDHVIVVEVFTAMEVAANVSVGAAGGVTPATSKLAEAALDAPIAFLQVSANV